MKNVLLVGDLRTMINNYGAIATSEMLIKEIKGHNVKLKCIDGRSMWNETPENGWETGVQDYISQNLVYINNNEKKSRIKHFLKTIPIIYYIKNVKHKKNDVFLPYLYSQYAKFAEEVVQGNKLKYEKKMIENSDIVLINGEGNIVKGTDDDGYYRIGGLYVLFIAYLSKIVFQKTTYVINHGVDPGNRDVIEIIKEVYPKLDGVYVREKKSIDLLKQIGVENSVFVADALFMLKKYNDNNVSLPREYRKWRDYSKKLICIGDSSGIQSPYSKVRWDIIDFYKRLIDRYKRNGYQIAFVDGFNGLNYEVNEIVRLTNSLHLKTSNCSYIELLYVFNDAEIYVSGRWHTSIIALVANKPILLWGADSHKTEALYNLINYNMKFFEVASLPLHVDEIYEESLKAISCFETERIKTIVEDMCESSVASIKQILE